eukprot:6207458-Pleurochrysis_carterae.AAC.2
MQTSSSLQEGLKQPIQCWGMQTCAHGSTLEVLLVPSGGIHQEQNGKQRSCKRKCIVGTLRRKGRQRTCPEECRCRTGVYRTPRDGVVPCFLPLIARREGLVVSAAGTCSMRRPCCLMNELSAPLRSDRSRAARSQL